MKYSELSDEQKAKRRAAVRRWELNHPELRKKYAAIERKNSAAKRRERGRTVDGPNWRRRNPHKLKAHNILNKALARGEVTRAEACSRCNGTHRIEGHHPDYSKPLEVTWLCRNCHRELHGLGAA